MSAHLLIQTLLSPGFADQYPKGPIVRINPHELSIDDGEFYNTLYVAGSVRRTENHHEFVKGLNFEGTTTI